MIQKDASWPMYATSINPAPGMEGTIKLGTELTGVVITGPSLMFQNPPEALPFRPEIPVYRVVLADAHEIFKIILRIGAPDRSFETKRGATWYCYEISASERKSKRQ